MNKYIHHFPQREWIFWIRRFTQSLLTAKNAHELKEGKKKAYIEISLDKLWHSTLPLDIMNEKGMKFSVYAEDFWKS